MQSRYSGDYFIRRLSTNKHVSILHLHNSKYNLRTSYKNSFGLLAGSPPDSSYTKPATLNANSEVIIKFRETQRYKLLLTIRLWSKRSLGIDTNYIFCSTRSHKCSATVVLFDNFVQFLLKSGWTS